MIICNGDDAKVSVQKASLEMYLKNVITLQPN